MNIINNLISNKFFTTFAEEVRATKNYEKIVLVAALAFMTLAAIQVVRRSKFPLYRLVHRFFNPILISPDGSKFTGTFDNLYSGKGTRSFPEGAVYKGTFITGKLNGEGSIHFKDGTVYEGLFKDDVLKKGKKTKDGIIETIG